MWALRIVLADPFECNIKCDILQSISEETKPIIIINVGRETIPSLFPFSFPFLFPFSFPLFSSPLPLSSSLPFSPYMRSSPTSGICPCKGSKSSKRIGFLPCLVLYLISWLAFLLLDSARGLAFFIKISIFNANDWFSSFPSKSMISSIHELLKATVSLRCVGIWNHSLWKVILISITWFYILVGNISYWGMVPKWRSMPEFHIII